MSIRYETQAQQRFQQLLFLISKFKDVLEHVALLALELMMNTFSKAKNHLRKHCMMPQKECNKKPFTFAEHTKMYNQLLKQSVQ